MYSSPNIIRVIKSRRMRCAGHVVRTGRGKLHTRLWWGNLRNRDHSEDTGRRWEGNIKMVLEEVGWNGMDLIDLVEDRDRWRALVDTVMNLRVP
jgi:hypothetical protein